MPTFRKDALLLSAIAITRCAGFEILDDKVAEALANHPLSIVSLAAERCAEIDCAPITTGWIAHNLALQVILIQLFFCFQLAKKKFKMIIDFFVLSSFFKLPVIF